MGYDSFGLPAENNAIKTGEPPREATERSIDSFRRQFREWGISIDWSRELATHTPEYYRWTQWIFLRLFEKGLAYRTEAPVQWCPKDATVLANEQVVDGRCERCGTEVIQRSLEQWFFKITDYADRLLADFDRARVLARARDHDAAQLDRPLRGRRGGLPLRGARPRLPGLHDPPRHPLRRHLLRPRPRAPRADAAGRGHRRPRRRCASTSTGSPASRPPSAAPRTARRPACRSAAASSTRSTARQIPMYVADYVLMEYGTGAIMAVPGHDCARLRIRPGLRAAGRAGDRGRGPRGRPRRARACPTPATGR